MSLAEEGAGWCRSRQSAVGEWLKPLTAQTELSPECRMLLQKPNVWLTKAGAGIAAVPFDDVANATIDEEAIGWFWHSLRLVYEAAGQAKLLD